MIITSLTLYRYNIPMHPFTIATGTMTEAENILLAVHTDEGITGWGECSPFPVITGETQDTGMAMGAVFARQWKQKDPLAMTERMKELDDYCAGNRTIKSAFNMALYDIAARAEGLPLYRFLKGTVRPLETDITIGINSPESMAATAAGVKEKGARIIKIKLGKNYKDDIERVKKIREAVGDALTLRLDANQGWDYGQAREVLQALGGYNIAFCEQPMRSWNDFLLPELREASPIKIMADESCYDHHDAARLIKAEACDYINIKLAKSGGLTEALKIHQVAAQAGIPCMIGGMLESRLATTANIHLAYACPEIRFIDQDSSLIGHLEDPVVDGVRYDGFSITIPELPGIGAAVDEAFLARCARVTV